MLNVIFDLHFSGNKADCNVCVLMPQSPIVSKLETTWQSSKQFCFGTFLSIYVQWKWNKWQISAFLEQYLWNIHTVARMWQLHVGKSNTWQKGESDQISLYHMENLCCSRGLIVLNSELKTCAIQKRWFFFEQLAAVVWTAEHFSEQITPTIWMAFLMIFLSIIPIAWRKASQRFLAVWTSTHWCTVSSCERSDKEIKSELGITVGPSFLYSRMNNATVSTWHERSTWPAAKILAGQVNILARHCLLTGHCFKPWYG